MGILKGLKSSDTKAVKEAMDAEAKAAEEVKVETPVEVPAEVPVEIVSLKSTKKQPVDVTEFPVQTTFNTDDMSIVEDGE